MASPIEVMLFDALCVAAKRNGVLLDELESHELVGHGCAFKPRRSAMVSRNPAIDSYRIDILIEAETWRLAIECDGFDFHDRTKQQAAYDRARDRELILIGITTIRFTGSEIVHSAERCAEEAIRVLEYLDDRARIHHDLLDRCGEIVRKAI